VVLKNNTRRCHALGPRFRALLMRWMTFAWKRGAPPVALARPVKTISHRAMMRRFGQ